MLLSGLVWDACALLNLGGSGHAADILPVFGCPHYVVKEVRIGEILYLRSPSKAEGSAGRSLIPFDLSPLLEAGLLEDIELTEAERKTYVVLTRELDDGEAQTAAAAIHRGLGVVTDDKDALRLLRSQTEPIRTLTTLEWLKLWAETAALPPELLGEVLRGIQIRANFHRPRRRVENAELCDWWDRYFPLSEEA